MLSLLERPALGRAVILVKGCYQLVLPGKRTLTHRRLNRKGRTAEKNQNISVTNYHWPRTEGRHASYWQSPQEMGVLRGSWSQTRMRLGNSAPDHFLPTPKHHLSPDTS